MSPDHPRRPVRRMAAGVGWGALSAVAELLRRQELRAERRRERARVADIRGR